MEEFGFHLEMIDSAEAMLSSMKDWERVLMWEAEDDGEEVGEEEDEEE